MLELFITNSMTDIKRDLTDDKQNDLEENSQNDSDKSLIDWMVESSDTGASTTPTNTPRPSRMHYFTTFLAYFSLGVSLLSLGLNLLPLLYPQMVPHLMSLYKSYMNPPPKDIYLEFRPPLTFSGNDPVTAKVCAFSLPHSNSSEEPETLGDMDPIHVADMMVANAFWKCPEDLAHYMFSPRFRIHLKLHLTRRRSPSGRCWENGNCLHLKSALYQPFKHLQDEVPGVQCVAARDSLGNEVSFVWGTDWSFDEEKSRVANTECVYDEEKADECWTV